MEPVLRVIENNDWITVTLFGSLIFIVIAKGLFYSRFLNFIILPFNNKYVVMYNKKDRLLNWFHIFLTLFQLLNFSLFIYYVWTVLIDPNGGEYPFLFPLILGVLILFLTSKIALQLGNGFVFNNNKIITEFIFKKLSYLNYSSLVMFLANVLLSYVLIDSKTLIFASIFLILLINAIGWFTIVKNHQKFLMAYFFYFILYLCALEITPFIVIANYLKD